MKKMNTEKSRFISACRRRRVDTTPVWFMRQAGRYMKEYRALRKKYSILELAKTPALAAEVTLQPIRAMKLDAAILFADILLPIQPMGLKLRFAPGPEIANPVRTPADVKRLRLFDPTDDLSCVMESTRLAVGELGDIPLIGFAGAPFTVASYMIEGGPSKNFLRTKAFMHGSPRAWDALMRKVRTVTVDYLKGQVAAGASAIQLFDSWAGALTPEQYRRFVLPHSRYCISAIKRLGVPTIHFGTGTAGFLEDLASAGSDVVGVDWRIDMSQALGRLRGKAVQGNLDPTLLFGPRPELKKAVRSILRSTNGRRGFIFNVGHGILPQTPVENVRAVVDWVHEYGVTR